MSNPALHSPAPSNVSVPQLSVPPYVAPAAVSDGEPIAASGGVRPFVPRPWRAAFVAPELAGAAAPLPKAVNAQPVTMENLGHIPPDQPLRPTPIVTAADRPPLYLPTEPTPAADLAVEDQGIIEQQLIHPVEFLVTEAVALEADVSDDGELPWIDAFLSATPAVPIATVPTPLANSRDREGATGKSAETSSSETAPAIVEAVADDKVAEEVVSAVVDSEAEAAPSDAWPLDDAVSHFRALSAQLDSAVNSFDSPEELFAEAAIPERLPAWSDDDAIDIMPIRHSGETPLESPAVISEGELWSERARKAQEEAQVSQANASADGAAETTETSAPLPPATAEQAAHALELLAQRVRGGELTLPGYDPRMGESAALVAALAAILGVRFR